jgi:Ni/Fe-hydrogenase subunit HybB-like protein
VLFFETLVVLLAIPAARALTEGHHGLILWGGLALAASCLLAAGLLRTSVGYVLGSAVQVAVLASGLVLPAMFILGAVFGGLWVLAIVLARKADRYARLRAAEPDAQP